MRRQKWLLRFIVLAMLFVLALIALDPRLIVRNYTVESDKMDEPIRLAVVTDFHGCNY